jgi:hypothetical protein
MPIQDTILAVDCPAFVPQECYEKKKKKKKKKQKMCKQTCKKGHKKEHVDG